MATLESTDNTRQIMERIRVAVQEMAPGARAILYGSRARGDASPESDWDLIIVVDGCMSLETEEAILHRLYRLGLEIGEVLSPLVYTRGDWNSPLRRATPFHRNVVTEGVLC